MPQGRLFSVAHSAFSPASAKRLAVVDGELLIEVKNPLQAYGQWLADQEDGWPDTAREAARRAFIDTLGVTVPGAFVASTKAVRTAAQHWGTGPATLIGTGASMSAPWAAMINGTAAHALDFDDNFDPAKAHASAVLVPCILALCEQEALGGARAIDAYIAGLQILGRVGQGLNPAHRNRGWHATGTVGAIGAAAAAARLLRLDAGQAAHALSLATSMAGGFMAQFGTLAKPLHAGLAAKAGVMAASLAQSGLTASMSALDGATGMQTLMVGPDVAALRAALTHVEHGQTLRFETVSIGEPLLLLESGLKVKGYPICGSAHRAIDGMIDLRAQHGLTANDMLEIHVHAPATHLANLMYERPTHPSEAKFSMEYGLAVAALTGDCRLDDFLPDALSRPGITELMQRVVRHGVDLPEGAFPTRIEIVTRDGRRLEAQIAMPRGSNAAPFSMDQYWSKFEGCLSGIVSKQGIDTARAGLNQFEMLDNITPLLASLRGERQG